MTGNVGAVFLFEWKRSLTVPRMAWWLVLALFLAIGVSGYFVEALRMAWQRPEGIAAQCSPVGNLLGTRVILNEFVAYSDLGQIYQNLNPRSVVIATYALCGFANIASIAMQVGGIGALAPSRKSDIARLGMKAMAAGTMANFMTAAIAGMLL